MVPRVQGLIEAQALPLSSHPVRYFRRRRGNRSERVLEHKAAINGCCTSSHRSLSRAISSARSGAGQARAVSTKTNISRNGSSNGQLGQRAKEKLLDKEFFYDLLSSAATKRDAKAYLSRLRSPNKPRLPPVNPRNSTEPTVVAATRHGVNLGSFFGHGRAVEDRPTFTQYKREDNERDSIETIHLALVKVVEPQRMDDATLSGMAQTLCQLARLSMVPCVVVDPRPHPHQETASLSRQQAVQQADRLAEAIDQVYVGGARRLDNLLTVSHQSHVCSIMSRKLLLRPLREGRIPVIAPIAYTEIDQQAVVVPADQVLLALTKELAGLNLEPPSSDDHIRTAEVSKALQTEVSVDRIILLDPLGGTKHPKGDTPLHAFINLEQEFDGIISELENSTAHSQTISSSHAQPISLSATPNERPKTRSASNNNEASAEIPSDGSVAYHVQNLKLLKSILALLPPTSSAIITTPDEAARSSRALERTEAVSEVGTRRQKNPLIHNLLTDKPAQSSSLPPGRLGLFNSDGLSKSSSAFPITSTFVKKGMPLTILPDPRISKWTPAGSRITLNDPQIDLPRLVHLIEDSFDRKLDVEDYLKRVNSRIAGLIIAGEYEGGALLTWEDPFDFSSPSTTTTPSSPMAAQQPPRPQTSRLVPYLDKFAVLKRSQGSGGVADIVFNAMVRGCFPSGVCWRSRRDNPVNKWYFERARGTWKIPETGWTMFWTGEGFGDSGRMVVDGAAVIAADASVDDSDGVGPTDGEPDTGTGARRDGLVGPRVDGKQRFHDYEAVCRGVRPSWGDGKRQID